MEQKNGKRGNRMTKDTSLYFEDYDIFSEEDDTLYCNVCGRSEDEVKINVHSAIHIPVSLCYCKDCDEAGYVAEWELIQWLARATPEEKSANAEVISGNCIEIWKCHWIRKKG